MAGCDTTFPKLDQARVAQYVSGQKQIWYLLRLVGRDNDVCLRASSHPEFDAWRWVTIGCPSRP